MSIRDELESLTIFQNLKPDSKALLDRVVLHTLAPPVPILEKGQPVSGAYLVLSGRLRVFSISPRGTEATLYTIERGETCVLALNCLFNDHLYPAWVQAEVQTRLAVVPGYVYRQLFEREAAIQNLTVQTLSTLVYRLMAELEDVHVHTHGQRLAQLLLARATAGGVVHLTQQQLAQRLGTTREVVARLMQGLVGRRLVRTGRGRIELKDLAGLRDVAQLGDDGLAEARAV